MASLFYILVATGSAAGFQCFNLALEFGFVPPPPGKYAGTDRHRWRNAATSLFNAVIVAYIVVYCVLNHEELLRDPMTYYTALADTCLALISGYLVYDTYDILVHTGFFKKWAIIVHHVVVAFVLYILSMERLAIGNSIIGLLSEISGIFLHSRQLLLIYGVSKRSLVYSVHKYFNLVTGILFRLLPIGYIGYVSLTSRLLPAYLAICLPPLLATVLAINSMMIWRLICSDFLSTKNDKVDFIMDN